MVFVFKPRNGSVDKSHCRASVVDQGFMGMLRHQCRRKPIVFETVDGEKVGLCKVHSTAEVEKRRKATQERYDAQLEMRLRPFNELKIYKAALQSIIKSPHAAKDIAHRALSKFEKD